MLRYEQQTFKIVTKMKENFERRIYKIATRHHIPVHIRNSLLDGLDGEVNQEVIREFKESSRKVLHGRTITVKREDSTIDLAHAMFSLEFKLPSQKIEKRRRKKFLGLITYGSHTAVRFEERNLSEKEKEHFRFLPHEVSRGI